MLNEGVSKSLYYEQKRDNIKGNIVFQISKILKWLLELIVRGIKAIFAALADAIKMLLHV